MTFPFISRAAHEQIVASVTRLADAEHANAQQLRRENADLLAKYHELASPKVAVTTVPIAAPKKPDRISTLIREQAGDDHRLAAHLRRYAGELRRMGKNDDEVAGLLVQWQTSEGVGASD